MSYWVTYSKFRVISLLSALLGLSMWFFFIICSNLNLLCDFFSAIWQCFLYFKHSVTDCIFNYLRKFMKFPMYLIRSLKDHLIIPQIFFLISCTLITAHCMVENSRDRPHLHCLWHCHLHFVKMQLISGANMCQDLFLLRFSYSCHSWEFL